VKSLDRLLFSHLSSFIRSLSSQRNNNFDVAGNFWKIRKKYHKKTNVIGKKPVFPLSNVPSYQCSSIWESNWMVCPSFSSSSPGFSASKLKRALHFPFLPPPLVAPALGGLETAGILPFSGSGGADELVAIGSPAIEAGRELLYDKFQSFK
jgi:hypothetical protein